MSCSCENKNEDVVNISEEFKIEFLNEVLSDSTGFQIMTSKDQYISNYGDGYMMPTILPKDLKNPKERISYVQYVSNKLHLSDTGFVYQQILENQKLDLNDLKRYGYHVFDLKGLVEKGLSYDSILKKFDSLNSGQKDADLLRFSKPVFNRNKNLVFMRFQNSGGGESIIFENFEGEWKINSRFDFWVE